MQSFVNDIQLVRTGRRVVERVSYGRDDGGWQAPTEAAGLDDGGATLVDVVGAEIHVEEVWRVDAYKPSNQNPVAVEFVSVRFYVCNELGVF